jgi:hypothetical protein
MKSIRESLPAEFLAQMQKELGREETLRLLWPLVVGPNLAASTRLVSIRGSRVRIAVPDRTWKRELAGLEKTILDTLHRACGEEFGRAIDLVEDAGLAGCGAASEKAAASVTAAEVPRLALHLPLEGIADGELRRIFGQSAAKYFARSEGARR